MHRKYDTAENILNAVNAMARKIYESRGYTTREGYPFYPTGRKDYHPQEEQSWWAAVACFKIATGIDAMDAFSELEDELIERFG